MIIGKVIGNVVSTQKREELVWYKLLIIAPLSKDKQEFTEQAIVAVDTVGAGIGEEVLVVIGSSARLIAGEKATVTPVDAAVVGIIDAIEEVNGSKDLST